MENDEMKVILENIEKESKVQSEYAKKQYELTKTNTYCFIALLVIVMIGTLVIVPKALTTVNKFDTVLTEAESISKVMSEQLPVLIENTGKLIGNDQSGLIEAIEAFNKFDIEGLNKAIDSLRATVEPLARLFGH